jgi:hypothetical protein
MRSRYVVIISRDIETAKKNLKNPILFVYLKVQKEIFAILSNGKLIREHRIEFTDTKATYVEEGEADYIQQQKDKMDKFFYREVDELKKDNLYSKYITDGRLKLAINKIKDSIESIKSITGTTALDYFSKLGITISWKIESLK